MDLPIAREELAATRRRIVDSRDGSHPCDHFHPATGRGDLATICGVCRWSDDSHQLRQSVLLIDALAEALPPFRVEHTTCHFTRDGEDRRCRKCVQVDRLLALVGRE